MRKLLTKIAAVVTRHDRYMPVITWSDKSWTHNTFRAYEYCFGRKVGLRLESSVQVGLDESGNQVLTRGIYTFEALIAHTETKLRSIQFKLPEINPIYGAVILDLFGHQRVFVANNGIINNIGYRFALALDDSSGVISTPGTGGTKNSLTYSQTCTGSDLILVVGAGERAVATATTYNGVSLNALTSYTTSAAQARHFWLAAPATGANNVVTSFSTTNWVTSIAQSWSGADSTIGSDSGVTLGSGTVLTDSVSSATGEVVINYASHGDVIGYTLGAGQTLVLALSFANAQATTYKAGETTTTMTMTVASASVGAMSLIAIKPSGGGGGGGGQNSNFLKFM